MDNIRDDSKKLIIKLIGSTIKKELNTKMIIFYCATIMVK
jgi:hypothetical protein